MTDLRPHETSSPRRRPGAGFVAGAALLIALAALSVALVALMKPATTATVEIHWPAVLIGGCGLVVAAMTAIARDMGVWDLLEAVFSAIAALLALLGAILRGIWNAILGLFGWD